MDFSIRKSPFYQQMVEKHGQAHRPSVINRLHAKSVIGLDNRRGTGDNFQSLLSSQRLTNQTGDKKN